MFRLLDRFAHRQNCGCRSYRVADADHGLLRDAPAMAANRGKNAGPHEREGQAEEIGGLAVWLDAVQSRNRGAQTGNLRQGEVYENHAALYHVNSEVSVDAGQDKARDERSEQER
jgi:hypothetical protein